MNSYQASFFKFARHPFRFGCYLFIKLPAAFFSGIRVKQINEDVCITRVPFKWLTQNPFKSTYFASLAMAAEMSTGLLALSNIYKRDLRISMLVIKMEALYFKKTTGTIWFTCEQGREFTSVIGQAIDTGEARTMIAKSTGINNVNEIIAEFAITWSFKARSENRNIINN